MLPSYRNQLIDLLYKSIGWFLYEGNTGTYNGLRGLLTHFKAMFHFYTPWKQKNRSFLFLGGVEIEMAWNGLIIYYKMYLEVMLTNARPSYQIASFRYFGKTVLN